MTSLSYKHAWDDDDDCCAVVSSFLDGKESDYDEHGFPSATNAVESDDGQRSEPHL